MKRVNAAFRRAAQYALSMFAMRGGIPTSVIQGPIERPRWIPVSERECPRTGRTITRVFDRRWYKPNEERGASVAGQDWRHNTNTSRMKRWREGRA